MHANNNTASAHGETLVEYKQMKFVITAAPTQDNVGDYIQILSKYGAKDVVRACEVTYTVEQFQPAGIDIHELPFPDGLQPPTAVIEEWLGLVKKRRAEGDAAIAVHCIAGLGRAPVLVAIALIESGLEPLDAIDFIRKRRRGAINAKQLKYLESYKRTKLLNKSKCVIQ